MPAQSSSCARLGSSIERIERDYFGLFPLIDDFISAQLSPAGDGFVIGIRYSEGDDVTERSVTLDAETAREFCRYIEVYEDLFLNDDGDIRWGLLSGASLVKPRDPFNADRIPVVVFLKDGSMISGIPLHAGSGILVIGPDSLPPDNRRKLVESAVAIHATEIERIRDRGDFVRNMTGGIDIAVRGDEGVFQDALDGGLSRMTLLNEFPSPELHSIIEEKRREKASGGIAPASPRATPGRSAPDLFHVGGSVVFLVPITSNRAGVQQFGETTEEKEIFQMRGVQWMIGADVEPVDRVRIGGTYIMYGRPGENAESDFDRVHGSGIEARGSFVLIPRSPYMGSLAERLELSATLGFGVHSLTVDSRIISPFSTTYWRDTTQTHDLFGISARIGADYYILRSLSLGVDARFDYLPDVEIPKMELPSKGGTGYILKTIHPHAITLSTMRASVGLRGHF